eukprot:2936616-Pleurochrysis_carterae.AAC.1
MRGHRKRRTCASSCAAVQPEMRTTATTTTTHPPPPRPSASSRAGGRGPAQHARRARRGLSRGHRRQGAAARAGSRRVRPLLAQRCNIRARAL